MPHMRRHGLGLRVLQEGLADPLVPLIEPDADHHDAGDPDDPGSTRPAENAGGRLVRVAGAARGAHEDLDRDEAQDAVGETARKRCDAVESLVGAFRAVPEAGADEPPDRVPGEPDREQHEQDMTESLMGDRVERALLVRDLAAVPDCQAEGEHADDPVDRGTRDEPGS
jgi:hypothetical protein